MFKKNTVGVFGLGNMGAGIAKNFIRNNISVSVYNRLTKDEMNIIPDFLNNNNSKNVLGFTNIYNFVNSLKRPRIILLLIPSGNIIDENIDNLKKILNNNDIIVDCGNSYFKNSRSRSEKLLKKRIFYIDCGISGGPKGAENGPSIMIGGPKKTSNKLQILFKKICAKDISNNPCCGFMGGIGSGHYVKMIHNGIEYAEMKLLTEVFTILKLTYNYSEISEIFNNWNKGKNKSYLLDATRKILLKKNIKNKYIIDSIDNKVKSKGSGKWCAIESLNLDLYNSLTVSSVISRNISNKSKLFIDRKKIKSSNEIDLKALEEALFMSRVINHYQGFELIQLASKKYNWKIENSKVSDVWSNGSILSSRLLNIISNHFKENQNVFYVDLLLNDVKFKENQLKKILKYSIDNNLPIDNFCSAYNFWMSITTGNLNSNLIQAQRDFFGKHGFLNLSNSKLESINWI
tara:strand:+ start:16208 stop:17587 length:1380 start_codon:yes stop_codon:yes gene_type:complete